jgi:hypothetical protein
MQLIKHRVTKPLTPGDRSRSDLLYFGPHNLRTGFLELGVHHQRSDSLITDSSSIEITWFLPGELPIEGRARLFKTREICGVGPWAFAQLYLGLVGLRVGASWRVE